MKDLLKIRPVVLFCVIGIFCQTWGTDDLSAAEGPAAATVSPEAADAIGKIEAAGGTARRIASNVDQMEVAFHLSGQPVTDETLLLLSDVPHVTWLYLQKTDITDDGLKHVGELKELRKLHLENTKITDDGLAHLTGLENLEYLNVYGTQVSNAGIPHLSKLKNLKQLYLWQTKVTDDGFKALATALPEAFIMGAAKPLAIPEKPATEAPNDDLAAKKSPEKDRKGLALLAEGQFVRVRLEGGDKFLSLAEVEVFQADDGKPLHTEGKTTQSSTGYNGPPELAIDGNVNTNFQANSTTHTEQETDPWWMLNLGDSKKIGEIQIWNRADGVGARLQGAVVEILDDCDAVIWSKKLEKVTDGSVHSFVE